MNETDFITELKAIAKHPAARGLDDDVAVLTFGRQKIVFTHDMLVESVHFLPADDPADVAWKLVAVNLSDLAGKGARPLGLLMGVARGRDAEWDRAFLAGIQAASQHYSVPLIGGDTVSMPEGGPRTLGMTAIGEARGHFVPSRGGAQAGDAIYVTGPIGDGWAGLQLATSDIPGDEQDKFADLLAAYRRPVPKLTEGRALANIVSAMMDLSDGLLLDAQRLAEASGVELALDLDKIPLSTSFATLFDESLESRLKAAGGGDDYQLLLTASPETVLPVPVTRIGKCQPGGGISLSFQGDSVALPDRLGFVHG